MDEEIKILFVDDEQNVLNALKRLFLDDGYIVLTATSGKDGLKHIEQEHVQIVISDYRMPGMNGVEFLREVYNRWPDTVRIVLSGYADIESIVSAINEGQIYKFIPKPWNDDELKVTISNAIERYFLFKRNTELTSELKRKNEELTKLNSELEQLLNEKIAHIEFRNKVLTSHQDILDAMPVGIIGINPDDFVFICNSAWIKLTGNAFCQLGHNAHSSLPKALISFIEEIKSSKKRIVNNLSINGVNGMLLGSYMETGEQKGTILVFVCTDDIL